MKKHTKVFYAALLAALVMTMPLAAQARPGGHGPGPDGPGGWCQTLPQEQRDAVWKLMQEHRAKMQPIRDQLWIKSRTLDALSGNSKVEPKDIEKMVNEMAALRTQLREEHKAFADRVKKETGVDLPGAGCGMGMGGGYGRHGGGDGPRGGHGGGHYGGMNR
ncbi:conserved exported hypothetical protein [uncultured delta proteobacterium]|uniref:Zinc resistance-associated protein n=1 Tax=uncultured delta proteobacterium TaxID=34034 RepID=A0A212JZ20_9DELT|nr:conserved exported hypothetical protein [uncultured delta proteobacterium]